MIFALAGNQNCGKTTLFNALTGSNQHVGNFPGVTVDQKMGEMKLAKDCSVVDLPGIYSIRPFSTEEINTLEKGLKTKEWASLTDETFQRHVEEFLDPEIKWVDYVVVTRLTKINTLLDWVKENKKLPIHKEEHCRFFENLKVELDNE